MAQRIQKPFPGAKVVKRAVSNLSGMSLEISSSIFEEAFEVIIW